MNSPKKIRLRLNLFRIVIIISLSLVVVIAAAIILGAMEETVCARGYIKGLHDYKLRSSQDGKLLQIYVKEGDTVKKGEAIAGYDKRKLTDELSALAGDMKELKARIKVKQCKIEVLKNDPLPARYRHAATDYKLSKVRFELGRDKEQVYERLVKKHAVSRMELNQVKLEQAINLAHLKRAENDRNIVAAGLAQKIIRHAQTELTLLTVTLAKLEKQFILLKAHLDDYTICAPCTGIITDLNVKPGQYMEAGEVVCRVSTIAGKKVVAMVEESVISKIQHGQSVRIESNSYNRFLFGHFKGKVVDVSELPEKQGEKYFYPVDVVVVNEPYDLKLGSGASVRIITGRQKIITALLGLDQYK